MCGSKLSDHFLRAKIIDMKRRHVHQDNDEWQECRTGGDETYWINKSTNKTSWTAPPPKRQSIENEMEPEAINVDDAAAVSVSTGNTIRSFLVPSPAKPKPDHIEGQVVLFAPEQVAPVLPKPLAPKPAGSLSLDQLTMNVERQGFPRGKDDEEYMGNERELWSAVKLAKALGVPFQGVRADNLKRSIMVELESRWTSAGKKMWEEASAFKPDLNTKLNRKRKGDGSAICMPKGTHAEKKARTATSALGSSSKTQPRQHHAVNKDRMVLDFGVEHGVHKVANVLLCGCGSDLSNMRKNTFTGGKKSHVLSEKHKSWQQGRSQTGIVQRGLESVIRDDTDAEAGQITVAEHTGRAQAVRAVFGAVGLTLNGVCGDTPYGEYYRGLLRNQRLNPCNLPKDQGTLSREYVPVLLRAERLDNVTIFTYPRAISCCIDGSNGMEVVVGRCVQRGNSKVIVCDRILDIFFVKGSVNSDTQPHLISEALGAVEMSLKMLKSVSMDAV